MKRIKYKSQYPDLNALIRDIIVIENNEPTFEVTLTTATTVTTVTNQMAGKDSFIGLMPTTQEAATEPVYVSSRGDGTFTLEHSSGSSVRTFTYYIFG